MQVAPSSHATRCPRQRGTHRLVYMRWPFCWFCSRVLAKSMGNTQVTPISPAMPPLMSLAGRLCVAEAGVRTHFLRHGAGVGRGRGRGCKAKTEALLLLT